MTIPWLTSMQLKQLMQQPRQKNVTLLSLQTMYGTNLCSLQAYSLRITTRSFLSVRLQNITTSEQWRYSRSFAQPIVQRLSMPILGWVSIGRLRSSQTYVVLVSVPSDLLLEDVYVQAVASAKGKTINWDLNAVWRYTDGVLVTWEDTFWRNSSTSITLLTGTHYGK